MTNCFQIANLQPDELGCWRAAPELVVCEVEGCQARKTVVPAPSRRIHVQDNVMVVLQEGESIPGCEGGVPPAEVGLTGDVNQHGLVNRGCQPLCGEDLVGEESSRPNLVGGIQQATHQRRQFTFSGVGFRKLGVKHEKESFQLVRRH